MQFHKRFQRYVGEGSDKIALGDDGDPAALEGEKSAAYFKRDNVFSLRMNSINAWPVQRLCVGYRGPAPLLGARLYFYDREEKLWYEVPDPKGEGVVELSHARLAWFDVPVLIDTVKTDSNLHGNSVIDLALVVAAAKPEGEYRFAFASDLSSSVG